MTFSNKKDNYNFILKKIKIKDFDFSEKIELTPEERKSINNKRASINSQEKSLRSSLKLTNLELKKIEKITASLGQYHNFINKNI